MAEFTMPQLRGAVMCHGCHAEIDDLATAILSGSCLFCGDLCEARAMGAHMAGTIPQLWGTLWQCSDREGAAHTYRVLTARLDEMKRRAEDMLRRIDAAGKGRPAGFDA